MRATLGDKPPSGLDKHQTPAAANGRQMSLVEKHSRQRDDHGPQHSSLIKDVTQKRLGGNSSLIAKNLSLVPTELNTLAHDRKTES